MKQQALHIWKITLLLAMSAFLASCVTVGQKRQMESDSHRLQELDAAVSVMQADLAENQAARSALEQEIERLNQQLQNLNDRASQDLTTIKELEASKTHLEDLLTRLQLVRMNGLMEPQTQTTIQPAIANNPTASPAPNRTPDPGNAIAATPPPDTNQLVPGPSALPLAGSTVVPAEGRELVLQGTFLQGRKERQPLRGTPLFSERDSVSGSLLYYHRDFWYDQPGLYIELSGSQEKGYRANLVVQTVISQADPQAEFGQLVFIKTGPDQNDPSPTNNFGFPVLRNYLRSQTLLLESLVYELDAPTINRLLDALGDPAPQWQVKRVDAAGQSPTTLPAPARKALLEMIQAYGDLRNEPLH